METTQRIILADIYGYCQRNKMLAKEREERELASESQTEEGAVSETDSIIHDVKVHATNVSEHENEVIPSHSPQLIHLENPPDITEELKVLTTDYPGNPRFRVTTVSEDDEQNAAQDSSSGEEELVNTGEMLPLVDLSEDSKNLPKLNSTEVTGDSLDNSIGLTGDLLGQRLNDPLVNLDTSDHSLGSVLLPNVAPTNLPTQTDIRITGRLLPYVFPDIQGF